MIEKWILVRMRENGVVQEHKVYSRPQAVNVLLKVKPVRRAGIFKIEPSDYGDELKVKKAVAVANGVTQLAFKLGVDRVNIYQWLKRATISANYRSEIEEYARQYDDLDMVEEDYEGS